MEYKCGELFLREVQRNSFEYCFDCTLCKKSFNSFDLMAEHAQSEHFPNLMPEPFTIPFTTKMEICEIEEKEMKHIIQDDILPQLSDEEILNSKFNCIVCGLEFDFIKDLNMHNCIKNKNVENIAPATTQGTNNCFECKVCGKSFEFQIAREAHAKTHKKNYAKKKSTKKKKNTYSSHEEVPLNPINSITPLQRNIKNNNDVLPKRIEQLEQNNTEKSKTDNFICDKCGKIFFKKAHLNRHYTFVHDIRTSFECSQPGCPAVYKYLLALRNHEKIHGITHHYELTSRAKTHPSAKIRNKLCNIPNKELQYSMNADEIQLQKKKGNVKYASRKTMNS